MGIKEGSCRLHGTQSQAEIFQHHLVATVGCLFLHEDVLAGQKETELSVC